MKTVLTLAFLALAGAALAEPVPVDPSLDYWTCTTYGRQCRQRCYNEYDRCMNRCEVAPSIACYTTCSAEDGACNAACPSDVCYEVY